MIFHMIKAIFVDFDGTFVDSLPALWKCYRLFLSRHGIDGEREEFTSLMGPPIAEIANVLKQKYQLEESIELLVQEYESIVSASYASQSVIFPWATNVLTEQKATGKSLAIVTAAHPSFVLKVLQCHGLTGLFDEIFGNRGGELPKPFPAIYQRALATFNIEPHEAIAIEDAPSGIDSACRAGISTIAFAPDIKESTQLKGDGPFYRAGNWQDIGKLLRDMLYER